MNKSLLAKIHQATSTETIHVSRQQAVSILRAHGTTATEVSRHACQGYVEALLWWGGKLKRTPDGQWYIRPYGCSPQ